MSVSWSLTAGQAVSRAFRMLGLLTPPWVPSDDQMTQGLLQLNALLKALGAGDAINVFRRTPISLTVAAMSTTVPIDPYVVGIIEARWVVTPPPNLYERALGEFTWTQYFQLPNKLSSTSSPSIFCFDRQQETAQLYIWPVAVNGGTINATVGRLANDVVLPSDPIDVPSEWILGLEYGLANSLMDDQGVAAADQATAQRIAGLAAQWHQKIADFDRPTSIYIRPWGKTASRLYR